MTLRTPRADFTTLSFNNVSRHFGRRRVLNDVTLQCGAGEILALLGPNGAGKSTLLSIAATLLDPTSGAVRYGNHTTASSGAALRARIGLLGHDLYLYPELSATENLTFFGRLYGLSDVESRVVAAVNRAGLAHRDDPVGHYSRGMRQRLALERALLHEPRLVLLDEPFTGLDDAATASLRLRLEELREAGCIVILTTHDLETIEGVVNRAVLIHRASLTVLGNAAGSLRERYRAACAAGV